MTTLSADQLVRRIHATPARAVLALTGGGSGAISQLLRVEGASRTVLEAIVPYAAPAAAAFLGSTPDSFCSARTARMMAVAAHQRACRYAAETGGDVDGQADGPLIGVACTASLASDRPKRGPHRAHLALQSVAATVTHSIELAKGRRTRAQEEDLVAALVLNLVALGCGEDGRVVVEMLDGERLEEVRTDAPAAWQRIYAGRSGAVLIDGDSSEGCERTDAQRMGLLVFPGAFHPLHDGHRRMARIAAERTGRPVQFELSIANVDKPPLDYTEIERRAGQLAGQSLWLTRAATFVEKADLFPRATFVVGADTVARIADPRYYDGDPAKRDAALAHLTRQNVRLLVFGRTIKGRFQTLSDLQLPAALFERCDEVPGESFRDDVSSTEIRRAQKL